MSYYIRKTDVFRLIILITSSVLHSIYLNLYNKIIKLNQTNTHEYLLLLLSCVWHFATSWTWANQAPSVHEIFQARILECVAIPFSRQSSWTRNRTCVSCMASKFFTTEPLQKSPTSLCSINSEMIKYPLWIWRYSCMKHLIHTWAYIIIRFTLKKIPIVHSYQNKI